MRTILKCFLIGLGVAALLSCAGTGQKTKSAESALPFERAPILVKDVKPVYPPEAWAEGDTATVWLKVFVDTLGNVSHPIVENESGDNLRAFEQSAKEAALKTKWKPAIEDGKPIAVWVTYKVDFYCPLRGMGEKPSPLGEDFSMLAVRSIVWTTIASRVTQSMTSSITWFGSPSTASRF